METPEKALIIFCVHDCISTQVINGKKKEHQSKGKAWWKLQQICYMTITSGARVWCPIRSRYRLDMFRGMVFLVKRAARLTL